MTIDVQPASSLRLLRLGDARDNAVGANDDEEDLTTGEDIADLQAAVGPGETVYFDAELATTGSTSLQLAVLVKTPPHPNGGFQVVGNSRYGSFKGDSFGADDFNIPCGVVRSQQPGTLLGMGTIRVRGVLANGPVGGLLKFQLSEAFEGVKVLVAIGNTSIWTKDLPDGLWTARSDNGSGFPYNLVSLGRPIAINDVSNGVVDMGASGEGFTDHAMPSDFADLMSIAFDPTTARLYIVGESTTNTVRFTTSTDYGAAWASSVELPDSAFIIGTVGNIAVDPADPNRIAVIFPSGATSNVAIRWSTNGGASWVTYTVETEEPLFFTVTQLLTFTSSGRLIIAAHMNTGAFANHVVVWYTDNPAGGFTQVLDLAGYFYPDAGTVALVTTTDGIVLLLRDTAWVSADDGATWTQKALPVAYTTASVNGWAYDAATDRLYLLFGTSATGNSTPDLSGNGKFWQVATPVSNWTATELEALSDTLPYANSGRPSGFMRGQLSLVAQS